MSIAPQVALNLALSSPNYIIFLIGLVVCIRRRLLHPKLSLVLACGLISLTIGSLLGNVGIPVTYDIVRANGGTDSTADVATGLVRATAAVPYAAGFALLLYGALSDRGGPAPAP